MGFFSGQVAPPVTLEQVEEGKIPRDQYDRPLIRPPGGGELIAYNRASSYGNKIEDMSNIEKWGKRQMIRGVTIDLDQWREEWKATGGNPTSSAIVHRVPHGAARTRGGEISTRDKKTLDALVLQADEAVGSQDKAALGTDIHYGTEVADLATMEDIAIGKAVSLVDLGDHLTELSPFLRERATAYWKFCRENGLRMTSVERFGVEDQNLVAGTWDRTGQVRGWPFPDRQRILDVKTSGTMDFAGIGFAVQLAEYAHMDEYDGATETRTPHENMDLELALIIHVSRESEGGVSLHPVDIKMGWQYANLARQVIEARRAGTKLVAKDDIQISNVSLADMIVGAGSAAELSDLWNRTGKKWWSFHKNLASQRAAELRS